MQTKYELLLLKDKLCLKYAIKIEAQDFVNTSYFFHADS